MSPRPRLADHALLRRHVIDGVERYVVHHALTGALLTLDERAFQIATLADGTRDLDGVALAASRAGLYQRASEIEAVLQALSDAGLIAHGVEPGPLPARSPSHWLTPAEAPEARRPLEPLPGFRFRCDGSGHCCEQYASVALTQDDELRARRAGLRTLPGDERGERALLPLYGGVRRERQAMTLVDGACLQLDAERGCALHRAAGAGAKPTACRLYPAIFADTGEALRVSTALECGCVFESAARADAGEPLIAPELRLAADLPAGLTVRVVPPTIAIGAGRRATREEVVAWTDAALAGDPGGCAVARAVALARGLETRGATPLAAEAASLPAASLAAELAEPVAHLAELTQRARVAADAWRSERDRTRQLRRAVATAARAVASRGVEASLVEVDPVLSAAERFALRATLFGLQLAEESRELPAALLDFAARLLVARELSLSGPAALGHPIAAVMASLRGG